MKSIRFVLRILFLGSFAISLNACSGGSSGPATLISITVTPANSSIPAGVTQQFAAYGLFSDNTSRDLTTQVTWSSSNPAVATVNSSGSATAVAVGTTAITAISGNTSGSMTLTVNSATLSSISVTPVNPSIPVGITQQLAASGAYSDGTSFDITTRVIWTSSNTSVATVNSSGLATSIAAGTATITATSGFMSASVIVMVTPTTLSSISVTPVNPSIPAGVTQQFSASGAYSDGTSCDLTTQVSWTSSNTSVATINSSGLATGVAAGTATITATSGAISGNLTLTVTSATLYSVLVTPANPMVPVGINPQFAASGAYSDGTSHDITTQVTWTSNITAVATVNGSGLATTIAPSTTTITANSGILVNGVYIQGATTLTVTSAILSSILITPANPIVPVGISTQFAASGIYSDGTSHDITAQVTWTSSNTSVATVNSSGRATAVAAGTATVTANAKSGTVLPGSTTLTVTSPTLSSISITPANPSIPAGVTQQFAASAVYSDGTSHDITAQVTWTSSKTSVATVNSSGLATGVAAGAATITAAITTTSGTTSGSTTLTVTPATLSSISVAPANSGMHVGFTQQFTAFGVYSDGTDHDITSQVTWSSSSNTVAIVNSSGMVTAVAGGTTTITATFGTIAGSTSLLVR